MKLTATHVHQVFREMSSSCDYLCLAYVTEYTVVYNIYQNKP